MKYENAAALLPAQLLHELQRYVPGKTLYVPSLRRKPWGEGTGARARYAQRNREIRRQYARGIDVDELGKTHYLSDESVR